MRYKNTQVLLEALRSGLLPRLRMAGRAEDAEQLADILDAASWSPMLEVLSALRQNLAALQAAPGLPDDLHERVMNWAQQVEIAFHEANLRLGNG